MSEPPQEDWLRRTPLQPAKCPSCGHPESTVEDTYRAHQTIKRRRECASCHHRYTTREILDAA